VSGSGLGGCSRDIAFAAQVLDAIPHDPHNLPVHILVTESDVFRFAGPDPSHSNADV
jgi:hypothetical protein